MKIDIKVVGCDINACPCRGCFGKCKGACRRAECIKFKDGPCRVLTFEEWQKEELKRCRKNDFKPV